jgi:hypothetical protein
MMATRKQIAAQNKLIKALEAPLDFEWDFACCDKCALEVARRIGIHIDEDIGATDLLGLFGVSEEDAREYYGVPRSEVTPAMVAAKLRELPR